MIAVEFSLEIPVLVQRDNEPQLITRMVGA